MPVTTASNGQAYSPCELVGYGATVQEQVFSDVQAGSTIRCAKLADIEPTNGDRVCIHVKAMGQAMRNFQLSIETHDAATKVYGILLDSEEEGVSVSGLDFRNVSITGSAASEGPGFGGIGIGLRFVMKSKFDHIKIKAFDNNIDYEQVGVSGNANNANTWVGLTARNADEAAFRIRGGDACRDVSVLGGTMEDNHAGVLIDEGSKCKVTVVGTHFENDVENVRIDSALATYTSFGAGYGGQPIGQGGDIRRTVGQANNVGHDSIYGSRLEHGVDYSVSGAWIDIYSTAIQTLPNLCGHPRQCSYTP